MKIDYIMSCGIKGLTNKQTRKRFESLKISIIDLGHKGIIWSIRLSAPMENILLVLIGNMKKMDLCYTIFSMLYIVGDI